MQKRKLHAEDQLAPPEDDEDDMFSDNFQPGKLQKSQHIPATADGLRKDSMPLLSEQYDDLDGYYKVSADDLIFDGSVGADKPPVKYQVSAVLGSPEERTKIVDADILQLVHDFVDFLEHCFILNPDKRINCSGSSSSSCRRIKTRIYNKLHE